MIGLISYSLIIKNLISVTVRTPALFLAFLPQICLTPHQVVFKNPFIKSSNLYVCIKKYLGLKLCYLEVMMIVFLLFQY